MRTVSIGKRTEMLRLGNLIYEAKSMGESILEDGNKLWLNRQRAWDYYKIYTEEAKKQSNFVKVEDSHVQEERAKIIIKYKEVLIEVSSEYELRMVLNVINE